METPTFIPIEQIKVNQYQPAEFIDQAQVLEIAESLRRYRDNGQKGLLQVPLARRVNGYYEEAFGRHRLLAFQHLATEDPFWSEMPLIIKDMTDQEMFELMGAENFKRREISPIEKARIFQDHITKFGAKSAETAAVFGVTEEFVRATIRLINLVPEAQQALMEGKINITTARSLLSMQKVASQEAIAETLKQIEKGEDRWGNQETPEQIVETAVNNLEEVVDMWNDRHEGKPRSSWANGWLLSMKNFPNRLLPRFTGHTAVQALDCFNDKPAQKLVLEWAEYLAADQATFHGEPPDQEYLDACEKQRQKRLDDLREINPDYVTRLQHLINPPACSACPFYTRINGSHYCGMKTCRTRKTEAWKEHTLQEAVKNLGIPLYTEKDGKREVLSYEHEKLFTARHKDLRLISRDNVRGSHWQNFKGVEDSMFLVVMVGETLQDKSKAIQEARAVVRQAQTAAERHNELVDQHCKLLEWEATLPIKSLFDGFTLATLPVLERAGFHWEADEDDAPEGTKPAEDAGDEVKADFRRRVFALAMLDEAEGRHAELRNNCESFALWLCDTLVSWGLKPPKGFVKAAQRFDQEIAEAVTAVTPKQNGKGRK